MDFSSSQAVWKQQAERWANVGPPTRPTVEDQTIMRHLVHDCLPPAGTAVVLGVTPELVQLEWPEGSLLKAVDASQDMIDKLWRPPLDIDAEVLHADWREMPFEDESIDFILGDGCFTAISGKSACLAVAVSVFRVLKPEAFLAIRYFIRPAQLEQLSFIERDAYNGKIQAFGALKWRLAMALCDPQTSTVEPQLVYRTFNDLFPDRVQLSRYCHWDAAVISTIDSYRDMTSPFTFLTEEELNDVMSPFAKQVQAFYGNYELADRCPTILYQKKS